MKQSINPLTRLAAWLWQPLAADAPFWKRVVTRLGRILFVLVRDLADGQLNLRAMSLVYTTLLSLVPLIAVSFSVLKAFGVHNQVEPMLLTVLAPLGEKAAEITAHITLFVDNIKVGVLGALGLALLLYTVVSLIQKIERAFNHTWHIHEQRPLSERFSDYLSVIMVGPVLVFSAMGITATITNASVVQEIAAIEPFGSLIHGVGRLVPYMLIIAAFTFIYIFVPNTRVRFRSALTGALVAGVLWETTGWAFASFVAGSTKYTAIYSGFAILIMFMIWLYLSWLILLVGASIAFYHQHPEFVIEERDNLILSSQMKDRIGVAVMQRIGERFYDGEQGLTARELSRALNLPIHLLYQVLAPLDNADILVRSSDDPPVYLPGRPLDQLHIGDILEVVRADGSRALTARHISPVSSRMQAVLSEAEELSRGTLNRQSVKELVLADQDN